MSSTRRSRVSWPLLLPDPPADNTVLNIALRLLRKHLDWPHSILKVQVLLMGAMVMQGIDCPGYSWDLLGCE